MDKKVVDVEAVVIVITPGSKESKLSVVRDYLHNGWDVEGVQFAGVSQDESTKGGYRLIYSLVKYEK